MLSGRLFRYYVATDVWVSIQSMCVPRFLSGSAALSNLIYIVGGRYQEQELACLEIYNPLNDTWFWVRGFHCNEFIFTFIFFSACFLKCSCQKHRL